MDQITNRTDDIGEMAERRFSEALSVCTNEEPAWFYGVEEASSFLDVRGVDFIAWVKYPHQREPLPVPIQVKSSVRGQQRYYEKHPQAKNADVVVVIVGRKLSPAGIRQELFRKLSRVRDKRVLYRSFFGEITCRPLTGRAIRLQQHIDTRRALRPAKPPETPAKPEGTLVFLPPPTTMWERLWHGLQANVRRAF